MSTPASQISGDFFSDIPDAPKPARQPRTKPGVRLDGVDPNLIDFAAQRDFTITSGRDSGGVHVRNSRHMSGNAVDLRVTDKSPDEVNRAISDAQAAGFNVLDERYGTGTGKHIHISTGRRAAKSPAPDFFSDIPDANDFFSDLPDAVNPSAQAATLPATSAHQIAPAVSLPTDAGATRPATQEGTLPPAGPQPPPPIDVPTIEPKVEMPPARAYTPTQTQGRRVVPLKRREAVTSTADTDVRLDPQTEQPSVSDPNLKPYDPLAGKDFAATAAIGANMLANPSPDYSRKHFEPITVRVEGRPSISAVNDALMDKLGPGWKALGQKFRRETGNEPIAQSLEQLRPSFEKPSWNYLKQVQNPASVTVTALPSSELIEPFKAYATGGLQAYYAKVNEGRATQIGEAGKFQNEQRNQGYLSQVGQDLTTGLAKTAQGSARYLENLKRIHEGEDPTTGNEDTRAIEQARAGMPDYKTLPGLVGGETVEAIGALARMYSLPGIGAPVQQYLENVDRGPEGALKAAAAVAAMEAAGVGADKIAKLTELSPAGRQVLMRAVQAETQSGIAAMEGAKGGELLKTAAMGALFPVGEGERVESDPTAPRIAPTERTARLSAQDMPDVSVPVNEGFDAPRVVKSSPVSEGQGAQEVAEPVRHVDLQKRDDTGQFREETPREASRRRARVTAATPEESNVTETPAVGGVAQAPAHTIIPQGEGVAPPTVRFQFGQTAEPQTGRLVSDAKAEEDVPLSPPRVAERSFPQSAESAGLSKGTNTTYEVIGDADSINRATKRIESQGADSVAAEIARSSEPSKDDIVACQILARRYAEAGDHEKEVAVINDVAEKLTKSGQAVQAASLISRLSPEGVLVQGQRILNKRGANRTLTAEEATSLKESAAKVREAEAKVSDLQRQIEEMKLKPSGQTKSPKIATVVDRLGKMEAEARARLDARKQAVVSGSQAGASTIPLDIADYAIIGAAKIAKGTINGAMWSAEMLKEFGEGIRPHLREIRKQSVQLYREHKDAENYDRLVARVTEGKPEEFTPEQIRELVQIEREKTSRTAKDRAALRSEYLLTLGPRQGPKLSEATERKAGPRVTEAPAYGPRLSEGLKSGPRPAKILTAIAERSQGDAQTMMGAAKFARPDMNLNTWAAEMKAEFGLEGRQARQAYRDSYSLYRDASRAVRQSGRRLTTEMLDAQTEARKARQSLAREFDNLRRTRLRKAARTAVDALGLTRALQTTLDLSAGLRQGKIGLARHPLIWAKSFVRQFPAMKEGNYERMVSELETDPEYKAAKKSGLYLSSLARTGSPLGAREEAFMSSLVEKIPGVRHSERAYTMMLDQLRMGWWKDYAGKLRKLGLDPENQRDAKAFQEGAQLINNSTGRGSLGRRLEGSRAATIANNVFFSPRFWSSRIRLLTETPARMLLPESAGGYSRPARVEAFKTLFAFTSVVAAQVALAKASGAQVNTDPDSPDFLKAKWGDMRVDFSAGFQGHIKLALRLAKHVYESKAKGEPPKSPVSDILETYARGKEAPTASLLHDVFFSKQTPEGYGTDIAGKPVYPIGKPGEKFLGSETLGRVKTSALARRLTPMVSQDATEAYSQMGWGGGVAAGALSFLGEGVQTYSDAGQRHQRGSRPARPSRPSR